MLDPAAALTGRECGALRAADLCRSLGKPLPGARLAQRIDAASLAQIRTVEATLARQLIAISLLAPEAG